MEFNLPSSFDKVKIISSEVGDGSIDMTSIDSNLPKIVEKYQIKSPVAYCEQVHSNKIEIIIDKGPYQACDGLITGESLALLVKSADCIPLLFFAPSKGIVGSIHAGRRSLVSGIISLSLKEALEKLSLSPTELKFFIAPHVRARNYEIKGEALREISESGYSPFLEEISSKTCFNLTKALSSDLVNIGVKVENIIDSEIDTFDDTRFFSYRRGDRNRLFATIIYKQPA